MQEEELLDSSLQSLVQWSPVLFGEKTGDETTQFFRTQDERNGQLIFVKKIDLSRDCFNEYQGEVRALSSLNHNNIVSLIEAGTELLKIDNQMHNFGYIILPYVGDLDLCDALANYKCKIDETDFTTFAYNLISAVNHIHSKGFIHRDLKLENIVLERYSIDNENLQFQFNPEYFNIIDFGSSYNYIDHYNDKDNYALLCFKRTQLYSPPEFINSGILTEKYDIFSCGIILYSIIAGHFPKFNYITNTDGVNIQMLSYDVDKLFDKEKWENISDEMQNVIKLMLTYDHLFRPTASQLLKFDIFQTQSFNFDLLDDVEPSCSF